MTVFIVDDSPMMQARLIEMCHSNGFIVVGTAETQEDALTGIAAHSPDVVLLDIRLRNGNGLEVLRAVKSAPKSPAVIVLTNFPHPKYREASLGLGADHFFHKATEFDDVETALARIGGAG